MAESWQRSSCIRSTSDSEHLKKKSCSDGQLHARGQGRWQLVWEIQAHRALTKGRGLQGVWASHSARVWWERRGCRWAAEDFIFFRMRDGHRTVTFQLFIFLEMIKEQTTKTVTAQQKTDRRTNGKIVRIWVHSWLATAALCSQAGFYTNADEDILRFIFQNANLKEGITLRDVTNERMAGCISF